jgi:hypothetical protein
MVGWGIDELYTAEMNDRLEGSTTWTYAALSTATRLYALRLLSLRCEFGTRGVFVWRCVR